MWIQVIQCLRKTGMSVAHIKEYNKLTLQGKDTVSQRRELVMRQRDILKTQIKEYQKLLKCLISSCFLNKGVLSALGSDIQIQQT